MENHHNCNNLSIGMTAPDFEATSTFGPVKMSDYKGKWVVFFSHPGDFTPVCTTEFVAFAKAYPKFSQLGTELLGLSIDSNSSHLAWVYSIYLNTGIEIPFPVIADRTGDISRKYGMIAPMVSNSETVRNVFIIDPNQKIRAILIYPLTNGRFIPEIIRLVEALQTTDRDKVVTPANWMPNQPAMVPPPKTYNELLERANNPEKLGLVCEDWWWCYKALPPENAQIKGDVNVIGNPQDKG